MISSSPNRIWVGCSRHECRDGLAAFVKRCGTRDADPGARRIVPRYDGAGELRVAGSHCTVRGQRLRPGKQNDEQDNEYPGRDDDTPSFGMPIVTFGLASGFETFQHGITPFAAGQQMG